MIYKFYRRNKFVGIVFILPGWSLGKLIGLFGPSRVERVQ